MVGTKKMEIGWVPESCMIHVGIASHPKSQDEVRTAVIICHAFNMPNKLDPPIKMDPFNQMSTYNSIVTVSAVICTTQLSSFSKITFSRPQSTLASCKKIHHTMHATMVLSKREVTSHHLQTIAFDSTQMMYHGYATKSWRGTI